jgi:hypothetical protein
MWFPKKDDGVIFDVRVESHGISNTRSPFGPGNQTEKNEGLASAASQEEKSPLGHGRCTSASIDAPDIALPYKFILLLTPDGAVSRHCRVVWWRAPMVGVIFLPEPA